MWLLVVLLLVIPQILSAPSMPTESKSMPNMIEEAKRLLVQIDQKLNSFDVKLFSEDASPLGALNLRPAPFPFTPDFAVKHLNIDEHGQVVAEDGLLSTADLELLRNISSSIFVDPESDAVLRIKQHPNSDEFTLEGIINDQRVSWDQDDSDFSIKHFLHSSNQNRKRRSSGDEATTTPIPPDKADAIDEHRPLIAGRAPPGTTVTANPDIVFLFDFENSKLFNWDKTKFIDYASIYINAVNNRFFTIPDPKITFSLAGIYTTKSKDLEKHFDKAKLLNESYYDSSKLLESFSYWIFENSKDVEKHDILAIMTSVEFDRGRSGLTYLASACWSQKSAVEKREMSIAIIHETGGVWDGAVTAAHEFAHSLGAPHDGEEKSATCPWADGYLMSYEGWGTLNKFKFSTCSQKAMREFIVSSGATCLSPNQQLKNLLTSTDPMGKRMSMEELCKKLSNKTEAKLYTDRIDSVCLMPICSFPTGVGYIKTQISPNVIVDDAPCGYGGKCREGFCVDQKPIISQEDKDKVCKQKKFDANSVSYDIFDYPADDQCIYVRCGAPNANKDEWLSVFKVLLGDGAPCNRVGKCKDGKCVMGTG